MTVTDGVSPQPGVSYRAAGVDVEAGERAVELMRRHVATASRPEVIGSLGGFAGLFALDVAKYRKPLLASSTDGVGTKIAIARALDVHDTVGIDLVAMVVDDLVVCGAEPLFLLDYVACGAVVPERIAAIVAGIARGCALAGCALVGGETAEHPGLMGVDDYDLAATGVGVVEADEVLGPERVRAGDVVIGMASSGLHSNGYSLVRHIIGGQGIGGQGIGGQGIGGQAADREAEPGSPGWPGGIGPVGRAALDRHEDDLGTTLGQALLTPTRIYALDCLALAEAVDVHVFAHVTGGGLAANLARVIPEDLVAVLDRATWSPPPLFGLLADRGRVPSSEMEKTFNLGVGMVAVVDPSAADTAVAALADRGVPAWVIGEVLPKVAAASAEPPVNDDTRAYLVGHHG